MRKFINNLFTGKKIKLEQQAEYLLVISKLLHNGFSLSQSINCLRLLNKKSSVFESIHNDLSRGEMVSQALRHLDLPLVVSNQLVIAQNHGKIGLALRQMGILMQSQLKQRNKLKELLAYPSFILSFLILMLVGMKTYIIPQMAISGSSQEIDLFLGIILGIIFIGFVVLVFFTWNIKRKQEYQRALQLVKLPFVGKIYLNFYQFIILQGLGMQLASGMNLYDICEANNRFQKGSIQAHLGNKFVNGLISGKNLLQMIVEEPLLPDQLQVIMEAGESGPKLAQDLLLMSELKFEETQRNLKKLLNLVQPILFFVIAIVILVTYLIVLLPIYGMMKGMS